MMTRNELAAAFLESIIQHGITDHKARYVREAFDWADAFELEVETRRLQWIEEQQSLKDDGLGGINTL
jgi:hypothetical protein